MQATEPAVVEPAGGEIDYAELERLQSDPAWWSLGDIKEALLVTQNTVYIWRMRTLEYLEKGEPVPFTHAVLPEPDDTVGNKPMWHAGTIRRWAMGVGRMLPDGTPRRLRAGRRTKITE